VLPYKGKQAQVIIQRFKNSINHYLPPTVKPRIVYKCNKLSSNFSLKDRTNLSHNHNIVYEYKCPANNCNVTYIGETSRRLKERVKDHQHRDKKSHIMKHSQTKDHPPAEEKHFKILGSNYNYYKDRKVAEAIYIMNKKPNLNVQEQSIPLKLFV